MPLEALEKDRGVRAGEPVACKDVEHRLFHRESLGGVPARLLELGINPDISAGDFIETEHQLDHFLEGGHLKR